MYYVQLFFHYIISEGQNINRDIVVKSISLGNTFLSHHHILYSLFQASLKESIRRYQNLIQYEFNQNFQNARDSL